MMLCIYLLYICTLMQPPTYLFPDFGALFAPTSQWTHSIN